MVKRKRVYKRSTKRRTRRRIRKRLSNRLTIGGFPKSKVVKLRYVDTFNLNAAAGVNSVYVFSANGMFDPNITGVGHQPSNFDRWTNNYDHYTVIGSKITVVPYLQGTTTVVPGIFGVLLSDSGTEVAGMGPANVLEQPLVTYSRYPYGSDLSSRRKITKTFSAKKFFGKNDVKDNNNIKGKLGSSNPTEQAFYEVFCASVGGNDPGTVHCMVFIDYIAVLTEPKTADSS